jgi:hypothetical protein
MNDAVISLARRVIKCRDWKWMSGMLAHRAGDPSANYDSFAKLFLGRSYRVHFLGEDGFVRCWMECFRASDVAYVPDLTDPATVGCLLTLVRQVWGPHASVVANGFEAENTVWSVHCGHMTDMDYGHEVSTGASEAEALVSALEKATELSKIRSNK